MPAEDPSSSPPTPARRWAASRARSPARQGHRARRRRGQRRGRARRGRSRERSSRSSWAACCPPASARRRRARRRWARACRSHVEATTVNKMCGSGMQAAIMAHDALAAGSADIIVAGGMESMTNAPYLLAKHRGGARIGHDTDHRPHVPRRPRGRLRAGQADGRLRRGDRARLPVHPRGAGRLRHRLADPRQGGAARRAPSTARSSPVEVTGRKGADDRRQRRAARQGRPRQDPDA